MSKVRILVVTPYVAHREAGHGTGAFMDGLLRRLAQRHDVTLATFCDESEEPFIRDLQNSRIDVHVVPRHRGRYATVSANAWLALRRGLDLLSCLVTWTPYYARKWRQGAMVRLVNELTRTRQFDIVQLELAFMAGYASAVKQGRIVLHEHDVAYRPAYRRYRRAKGAVRLVHYLDWCMWTKYELNAVKNADGVLTVTPQDQALLKRLTRVSTIGYLPRSVEMPVPRPGATKDPATVLFVGSYAHVPNVDGAFEILRTVAPAVWREMPEARFVLAGPHPPEALREEARGHARVTVTGFVKDLDALLRGSTIFLAPLRIGGGVKVKVLQAMAYALPVVTTPLGAEGIEGAVPGVSLLVGRTTSELCDAVCRLLRDPGYARSIGSAGFAAIQRFYSWERVLSTLEEFYQTTVQQRKV